MGKFPLEKLPCELIGLIVDCLDAQEELAC